MFGLRRLAPLAIIPSLLLAACGGSEEPTAGARPLAIAAQAMCDAGIDGVNRADAREVELMGEACDLAAERAIAAGKPMPRGGVDIRTRTPAPGARAAQAMCESPTMAMMRRMNAREAKLWDEACGLAAARSK